MESLILVETLKSKQPYLYEMTSMNKVANIHFFVGILYFSQNFSKIVILRVE